MLFKTQSALANEKEKDSPIDIQAKAMDGLFTKKKKKFFFNVQIANAFVKRCSKTKKSTKNSQNVQIKIM